VLEEGTPRRVRGEEGYDAEDLGEYATAVEALDELAAGVPLDRPREASQAGSFDAATFDTWLNEHVHRPGARTMLATTVANVFAAEPGQMSLLHVLFYIRSGGG
jgi:monoamine oxidase